MGWHASQRHMQAAYDKWIACEPHPPLARRYSPNPFSLPPPPGFPSLLTWVRRLISAEQLQAYLLRRNTNPKPYDLEYPGVDCEEDGPVTRVHWRCWANLTISFTLDRPTYPDGEYLPDTPALDPNYDPHHTPQTIPHHPTSYDDISPYIIITPHALKSAWLAAASHSLAPPPPGVMPLLPPCSYAQTDHTGVFPQVRLAFEELIMHRLHAYHEDGLLGPKTSWHLSEDEDDLSPSPALTDHSDHDQNDESDGPLSDYEPEGSI